jgi:hypothetical protein
MFHIKLVAVNVCWTGSCLKTMAFIGRWDCYWHCCNTAISRSKDSSVNTVTRLRTRKPENEGSIKGRGRKYAFPYRFQIHSRTHPPSYSVSRRTGVLSQGVKWPVVNLTSHHHLMESLRMSGVIPLLPNMSTWRSAKVSIGLCWPIQWILAAFMKLWSAHCLWIQQMLFSIWSHFFVLFSVRFSKGDYLFWCMYDTEVKRYKYCHLKLLLWTEDHGSKVFGCNSTGKQNRVGLLSNLPTWK